jgi:hypothetical protein
MTIKDKRKPEGKFITDVPAGTVFEDVDGFFMKTDGKEKNVTETINLKTGETVLCPDTLLVKPLNVELVIKEEEGE